MSHAAYVYDIFFLVPLFRDSYALSYSQQMMTLAIRKGEILPYHHTNMLMNDVSCFVCFLHTVITLCNQCSVLIFNIWIWTKLVYFPLLNQNPTKSIGAAFLLLFGVTLSLYLLNQILISETIHTHIIYIYSH